MPALTGWEHLLSRAVWDHDGVRDDVRDYLVEHLGAEACAAMRAGPFSGPCDGRDSTEAQDGQDQLRRPDRGGV